MTTLYLQGSHLEVVAYYSSRGQFYLLNYIAKRTTIFAMVGATPAHSPRVLEEHPHATLL